MRKSSQLNRFTITVLSIAFHLGLNAGEDKLRPLHPYEWKEEYSQSAPVNRSKSTLVDDLEKPKDIFSEWEWKSRSPSQVAKYLKAKGVKFQCLSLLKKEKLFTEQLTLNGDLLSVQISRCSVLKDKTLDEHDSIGLRRIRLKFTNSESFDYACFQSHQGDPMRSFFFDLNGEYRICRGSKVEEFDRIGRPHDPYTEEEEDAMSRSEESPSRKEETRSRNEDADSSILPDENLEPRRKTRSDNPIKEKSMDESPLEETPKPNKKTKATPEPNSDNFFRDYFKIK